MLPRFHLPKNDVTYFGTYQKRYARIRPALTNGEQAIAPFWMVFSPKRVRVVLRENGIALPIRQSKDRPYLSRDGLVYLPLEDAPPMMPVMKEQEACLLHLMRAVSYKPSELLFKYLATMLQAATGTVTTKRAPH